MRSLAVLGVCVLSLASLLLARGPQAAAPVGMKEYWLGLIYRGASWTPEVDANVLALHRAHLDNIRRLHETGEMVLAGPFGEDGDLRGLFLFDVPTRARAEELVAGDPAVAAGRLRVELHSWWGVDLLPRLKELAGTVAPGGASPGAPEPGEKTGDEAPTVGEPAKR